MVYGTESSIDGLRTRSVIGASIASCRAVSGSQVTRAVRKPNGSMPRRSSSTTSESKAAKAAAASPCKNRRPAPCRAELTQPSQSGSRDQGDSGSQGEAQPNVPVGKPVMTGLPPARTSTAGAAAVCRTMSRPVINGRAVVGFTNWSATGDRSTTAYRTLEFCGFINESEAPSARDETGTR